MNRRPDCSRIWHSDASSHSGNSFELFLKAPSTPKIVHRDAKFTSFLWPNRTANAKQEFQVWKPPMEKISHGNSWSPPEFPEENPKFPTEPSGNSNQKPRSFFYGNRSLLGKPPEVSPAGSTWNHLKLFTFYETKKFLDVFLEAKAIFETLFILETFHFGDFSFRGAHHFGETPSLLRLFSTKLLADPLDSV